MLSLIWPGWRACTSAVPAQPYGAVGVPRSPAFHIATMTRPALRRYTPLMRTLIAALALLPTFALADIAGPARVIDGDTIEIALRRRRSGF